MGDAIYHAVAVFGIIVVPHVLPSSLEIVLVYFSSILCEPTHSTPTTSAILRKAKIRAIFLRQPLRHRNPRHRRRFAVCKAFVVLISVIMQRPKLFGQLLRELKSQPDHAILRIAREIEDGEW